MPKLQEGDVHGIQIPAGKKDAFLFDDQVEGLAIRKYASRKACYIVKYSIDGQQRRITLKGYDPKRTGDLADARAEAQRIRRQAKRNKVDEREKLAREKQARKDADDARRAERKAEADARKHARDERLGRAAPRTVLDFLTAETVPLANGRKKPGYLQYRGSKVAAGTLSETHRRDETRYLMRIWQPLHHLAPAEVTNMLVRGQLDIAAETLGEVAADRSKAALSTFFAWLIEGQHATANPVSGVRAKANNEARERDRILTDRELRDVWHAVEGMGDYAPIIRLCILTGARKTEIASLAWSEIDFAKGEIVLPANRIKNRLKGGFVLPMSDQVFQILRSVEQKPGRPVFGAGRHGFTGWSKAKAELDSRLTEGMPHWTIHDLRRTMRTGLGWLRINSEVAERCINHKLAGVHRVYDRYDRYDEKRDAFRRWGAHVAGLVSDQSNVVPLAALAG